VTPSPGARETRRRAGPLYQRPQLRVHRWTVAEPRVVVAHEIRIAGAALRRALAGRAQVLSQTVFGSAAVALCELLGPHVAVVGDLLADGVIEQFLPGIVRSGTRVLVVADDLDGLHGLRLLRQGASGLISLGSSLDDVAAGVEALARGEAIIPNRLAEALLLEWRASSPLPASAANALTGRELEVLAALADGMGTKAVAHRLGIASKTAENYKTRIFQKLGVRTQAEAITMVRAADRPSGPGGHPDPSDARAPGLRLA
jgi:DNA-binding NarL/FixJ family response regulator